MSVIMNASVYSFLQLNIASFLLGPENFPQHSGENFEMGGTCGTFGGREKCAQGFGGET